MSTDSGSGNRWEPTSPASDGDDAATERIEQPAERERAGWRDGLPARPGWLAAGAAAVFFVVGGAGGFMVGHATAADARDRAPFGQQGPRSGFGPGGGVPGQPPGIPRQDDRQDDRQDEHRGQDPGRTGSGA